MASNKSFHVVIYRGKKAREFLGLFYHYKYLMYRIRCHTLFDITKTGVLNRKAPSNSTEEFVLDWEHKRNTQCNFDTLIQVISLRAQPEEISNTKKHEVNFRESNNFGFLFEEEDIQPYWSFDFTINQMKVF